LNVVADGVGRQLDPRQATRGARQPL
jgi:hypothetical protein